MKMRVQAQHLQPGDVVGSGEEVARIDINSIHWPSNKVCVTLIKPNPMDAEQVILRRILWGKYTLINVERVEKPLLAIETREDGIS